MCYQIEFAFFFFWIDMKCNELPCVHHYDGSRSLVVLVSSREKKNSQPRWCCPEALGQFARLPITFGCVLSSGRQ